MKQCVEIDENGYISSVCPGTSELSSFYNITNKNNLTDDQLLFCTLKKVADKYIPVYDETKHAVHLEKMKELEKEMADIPSTQEEINALKQSLAEKEEELTALQIAMVEVFETVLGGM